MVCFSEQFIFWGDLGGNVHRQGSVGSHVLILAYYLLSMGFFYVSFFIRYSCLMFVINSYEVALVGVVFSIAYFFCGCY